jgi:hypothetical protein
MLHAWAALSSVIKPLRNYWVGFTAGLKAETHNSTRPLIRDEILRSTSGKSF